MNYQSAPSGYEIGTVQKFTPQMMEIFSKLLSSISGGDLQSGIERLSSIARGDDSAFADMEKHYYSKLEQALGQTASKFSQYGARRSSAFEQASSQAAQNVAQEIGQNRANMSQQALQSLMGLGTNLLGQQPQENVLVPEKDTDILPIILSLLGSGAAAYAAKG